MTTPLIMFHHFHNERHVKGQGSIDSQRLHEIIEKIGGKILSADEWFYKKQRNTLNEDETCLSFDDNLKCQYEIALPVLNYLNIKAFWFINSGPLYGIGRELEIYRNFRSSYFEDFDDFFTSFLKVSCESVYSQKIADAETRFDLNNYLSEFSFYSRNDRIFRYIRNEILEEHEYFELMDHMIQLYCGKDKYENPDLWMNRDELKFLSDNGHIIGLHSHTHFTTTSNLSFEKQRNDYYVNYSILSEITGERIKTVSYPSNSYNTDTFRILHDLGIQLGFKSNSDYSCIDVDYEFPRIDHTLLGL